jgi:PAS domain S-box-containing protein
MPGAGLRFATQRGYALWKPASVFLAAGLVSLTLGYLLYRSQIEQVRADRGAQILFVANHTADQVGRWLDDQLQDLALDATYLEAISPDGLPASDQRVVRQLERMIAARHLTGVALFDSNGRRLASAGETIWGGASVQGLLFEVARTGKGVISDLARPDDGSPEVALDFAVPMPGWRPGAAHVAAVLVARVNAADALSPLVDVGTTRLHTLESTLLRRDADRVLILTPLRLSDEAPFTLAFPVDQSHLASVRMALGETGLIEAFDRRGQPVLAVAIPVAGTSWLAAAKVDVAEINAPLKRFTLLAGALVVSALLAAALLVGLWWRTERRKMALELGRAEARATALVEHFGSVTRHVNDMVFLLDDELRILEVNERVTEALGYRREELIGRHMRELHAGDSQTRAAGRRATEELLRTGRLHFVAEYRRKDGSLLPFEASARCFESHGRKLIQSIARDVTERRAQEVRLAELTAERDRALRESHDKLERLVEERTRDLVEARDRAQHADHVKSEFLATMSHELRTPLNSILGFTDVMLQGMVGALTGEQQRHLGIVRESSFHLLELINDVLDMSRIEAGQLRLEPVTFDVVELVRRRMQAFEAAARERGLELRVEVEPGTGDAVGDPRRVAQVIGNLVSNALKFTEAGRIVVSSRRTGEQVEIAVRDTGAGIAPENLTELFAPFRQFRSPTGRLHEGTGLGLAISRNLARAMGGDVRVNSVVGEGSTFTLVLPASAVEAPSATAGLRSVAARTAG